MRYRSGSRRLAAVLVAVACASAATADTAAAAGDPGQTPASGTDRHAHRPPAVLAPGYADLEFVPPRAGSYALPPLGHAADGPVLDAAGTRRSLHELMADRVVLLSFIYTRCSDVNGCPLATFVMKGVQDRVLADPSLENRVRLLSMSFDPAYDTPEVLARYAGHFRAPGFDWHFLTAASERVLAPTLDAYDQWIIRDYDENGNYLGTVSHVLRVYLIDERRQIRNIYSTAFLHADTVVNDVRTLLRERDGGPSRPAG